MTKQLTKRQRKEIQQRQQQRRYFIWSAAIGVISLLLIGGALAFGSRATRAVDATDDDLVALGQQVYDAQCAACHGADLEGEADWQRPGENGLLKAPPHDETGHTWHHDDAYLIESVKLGGTRLPANIGISGMPAYGSILTDDEIVAVLAFIKSAWPPEIRAAQAEG